MTTIKLGPEVGRAMGFKKISTEPLPQTVGPVDPIDGTEDDTNVETVPELFRYDKPKDENPQLTSHQQISQEPGNQTFADIG